MKNFKILSLVFITSIAAGYAQDIDQAKKAMDAEQYEKAKVMLKNNLQAKPDNGKAAFLLGNIYLKQNIEDSAKIFFQRGLSTSDGAKLSTIGLGHIDLENGNNVAAQAKFDQVLAQLKKRDIEEYLYIAQAYMSNSKPDYKAAINLLLKAQTANPNDASVKLFLGDAYYGDRSQNEAYVSYRDAYAIDNTMIRAKMQLGVLLKGAKAYEEAVKAYDEVLALNPNYGPVFRELAETYYLWANNKPSTYSANISKALSNYEKYLSLTDYSLPSRMRHADFLILAKDFKALEAEANEMKKLDKVNPRILRYLGYSAYQNGNYDSAISALTEYITKGTNKVIAADYYNLGLAKIAKSVAADGKTVDATALSMGTADIKKSLEIDLVIANGINEVAKKYFTQKLYSIASALFELAITNPDSKNYLEDNVYFGLSVLTENRGKEFKEVNMIALQNADKAMDTVITATPNYQEAYLYKARINSTMEKDDVMAATYEKYLEYAFAKLKIELEKVNVDVTNNKFIPDLYKNTLKDFNYSIYKDELNRLKPKVTEAYNSIAAFYANTDKVKAKEYFAKTLEIDPTNTYATESLMKLK
ncbi:tetratricopeptide repeat protein [Flavobacterium sp.]|jgi:lipopolysaccharide biosynthesis regulator YciM|uniref:tetratricopeptide repeat protein n=1 Tax=Flavobacterium sp. TaxID=239 RepID=UPI0037BF1B67